MYERIKNAVFARGTFFKGSIALVFTTMGSYILGLVRDRQLAHVFGASHFLDAYNAAFSIPDIILNVFVAGALSAAFVPIFTELTSNGDRKDSDTFVSSVLSGSILVVGIVGAIVFVLAPWISRVAVSGLDIEGQKVYANLLRMLLLSPLIFAVSNTIGSILATKERFFWYGMSSIFYNLGTILGTIILAPYIGIYGSAIGTLAGALLHLAPRIFAAKQYFCFHPGITITTHFRSFLRIMIPKMAGHPIEQITFLCFTAIASTFKEGSIAIMNFAHNFQSMPINVIGATFGLTIFPLLARTVVQRNRRAFMRETSFGVGAIFILSALAGLVLFLIRRPLIAILLGGGKFDLQAIQATAALLSVFVLAIPTESINQILARSFYALKNSITPTLISGLGLILSVGFAYQTRNSLGLSGIAYGYLIGSATRTLLMGILLKRESLTLEKSS